MYPIILPIYGPIALHSFSIALALGLFVFFRLCMRHPLRKRYLSEDEFVALTVECGFAGLVGGRLLHLLGDWHYYRSYSEMLSIWNGGLSILGTIFGILCYGIWFLHRRKLAILPISDLASLYAPLAHAIARIGCFLAGCCYGKPSTVAWAITYTNPDVIAPLHISLHPTQLYSSLTFLAIFLVLRFVLSRWFTKPGQTTMAYLMLLSGERLAIDFLRGDRIIDSTASLINTHFLSLHQWIALATFFIALAVFLYVSRAQKPYAYLIHESV